MVKKDLQFRNDFQKNLLNLNNFKKFSLKFNDIFSNVKTDITKSNNTLHILSNKTEFNFSLKKIQKYKKKFNTIALIGMGGSILGSEAINSFLKYKIKKKVYFFDDVDTKKILLFKKKENINKTLFIVISKSGETIETISNLFALEILKKNSKNIIIISEKKNNFLYNLAKTLNLFYIEHNPYVGGRYSVLGEVGLIPGFLMGIDIRKLRSSIKTFLISKKERSFLKDSVVKLASLKKSKNIKNIVFLNYAPEMEKFLFWCQQLIAESLGKKGKGFFPVISNVPKDHHSLLQLYLDGPKDKLFYIFSSSEKEKIKLKKNKNFQIHKYLNKKSLSFIKNAQKKALIKSFKINQISYREFIVKKNNETVLGKLFSYFILETIIFAKLVGINPFNQPAVEQVKIHTKKLLS